MESSCLKEFRKQLSWLMQNHKAHEALLNIRAMTRRRLHPHEQIMSDDCFEDIRHGTPAEELLVPILELSQENPHLHWVYIDLLLRVLAKDSDKSMDYHQDANRVIQHTHARIKEVTIPERALKRAQESLERSLRKQTQLLRKGLIELQQTQRDLEDALHHPNTLILTRSLKLIREWKRRVISGQTVRHLKSDYQIGYRLDDDTPILLAEKLLNHQPSCEDISVALSTLARTENGRETAIKLAENLQRKLHQANSRSLGTSLWALAKLDIGSEFAPAITQALLKIIHDLSEEDLPDRVTTVSSLWAMAALDVPLEYVEGMLDYAEGLDDLNASDTTRCFHVSTYYDYETEYWQHEFDRFRPSHDTWYARKFRNNGETRTHDLVQQFMKLYDISGDTELNGHSFGLECDVLVTLENGQLIDVEFDGPVHQFKTGGDHFRDRVLKKLGVKVIRLSHKNIPYNDDKPALKLPIIRLFEPILHLSQNRVGL